MILVFFMINLMPMILYFSSRTDSPCFNLFRWLCVPTIVTFAVPLLIGSRPSLCSAYMHWNEKIFYAISYKLMVYANFVFNLEE